jgi:hypothetical protein
MRGNKVWLNSQGFAVALFGFIQPSLCVKQIGQIVVGFWLMGTQGDSAAKACSSLTPLAQCLVYVAKVQVGVGMIWLEGRSLPEMTRSCLGIPLCRKQRAKQKMRSRMQWLCMENTLIERFGRVKMTAPVEAKCLLQPRCNRIHGKTACLFAGNSFHVWSHFGYNFCLLGKGN